MSKGQPESPGIRLVDFRELFGHLLEKLTATPDFVAEMIELLEQWRENLLELTGKLQLVDPLYERLR